MSTFTFNQSLTIGYGCLSAWSDLLDRINVYPVADSDTGTNLRISLAPLRECTGNTLDIPDQLARSATGNSGNIAAAFFRQFCKTEDTAELAKFTALGRNMAWKSIADPCAGTMLNVFDSLAKTLEVHQDLTTLYQPLSKSLQQAVNNTSEILPSCKQAGVVDSGALGMYIFFEGFFRHLTESKAPPTPLFDLFVNKLAISNSYQPIPQNAHCVDLTLKTVGDPSVTRDEIAALGESVVILDDTSEFKVHIHTTDPKDLKDQLENMGDILQWSDTPIKQIKPSLKPASGGEQALHIVTDAAGSLPRDLARKMDITLLDSYIIAGDTVKPESLYLPDQIYPYMRQGQKFTTAQASNFERQQHYQSICQQFGPSLYLCVGSAFTGNYIAARAWKDQHDRDNLFTILDTGAASGRLALITLLTTRYAKSAVSSKEVISFAQNKLNDCEEFVFIDELKYLVAGGRVSRTGGFFGDLLHLKPVISPRHEGVRKMGMVRSGKAQIAFALRKLTDLFDQTAAAVIMLNYSDNKDWVTSAIQPRIQALLPEAEILITPLSLTSGVHMGPGTWSMACASAS